MPVTAIIKLRALSQGPVSRSFHCLMHPVLLDRIATVQPELAKALHDAKGLMPFSLSPVMGVRKRVRENQSCWVRIGILSQELEDGFCQSLESGKWQEPIALEEHRFGVEEVVLGSRAEDPWTGRTSYQEMMLTPELGKKAGLTFISPVAFKRGELHYPLPEPGLIFQNLARRWDRLTRFPLPSDLDFQAVSCSHFDLRTRPYTLRKGGTIVGAVGKLSFHFPKKDENLTFCCQVLLEFAFYAGIGVKTTQGMGLCRIHRPGG